MVNAAAVSRALTLFPVAGAPLLTTSRPGLRARAAAHAAFKAAEQHVANLTALRRFEEPDLNEEAALELRGELQKGIRTQTAGQFSNTATGYLTAAEAAAAEAEKAAAGVRLKFDPESPAQALRTDQAWRNTVEPMLAAGKRWDQIIPHLDADGLLAVERFAPGREARIRDFTQQHEVPGELAALREACQRQEVRIATPEAREVLREAQDANAALDFVRTVSNWVNNESDPVTVSIGLKNIGFRVGAQNPVDTSPDAQAVYSAGLSQIPA